MTEQIEQAMRDELEHLDWMSPATKVKAIDKPQGHRQQDRPPRRMARLQQRSHARDDFYGNVTRAMQFEVHRQLGKIGKPLDRGEWGMTPPTVNAYYSAQMNDINFPLGCCNPPLFDPRWTTRRATANTGGHHWSRTHSRL
ncbi:MAG: hypothetical protein IPI09_20235 [Burkholderiales bacterium]|nr:hypothetical protein [Burkholderiales bacterium]